MRIAVVSPHLDDACFGVAEHMLSRPDDDFTIVTPCGAIPEAEPHRRKYQVLSEEHRQVCIRGGWDWVNGPYFDDAVFGKVAFSREEVGEWIDRAIRHSAADQVWAPFGIHHPDHIEMFEAIEHMVGGPAEWLWYEELPYRVLYPWDAACRWRSMNDRGVDMKLVGCDPMMLEPKRRLCRLYASQIGPDIERCLYVPERLWEVSS